VPWGGGEGSDKGRLFEPLPASAPSWRAHLCDRADAPRLLIVLIPVQEIGERDLRDQRRLTQTIDAMSSVVMPSPQRPCLLFGKFTKAHVAFQP
jgi:hypothetical protein